MDIKLARRLEKDKAFREKLTRMVADYATAGFNAVSAWAGEYDVASDMLHAYAPLTQKDFKQLERGHPKRFVLPMTATQITTMTTFVTQMLYGSDSPHRVVGRGSEDEVPAEHLNSLLRWGDEQQPTYSLGYLFVQDAITFNRGIFYNCWRPIFRPKVEMVEVTDDDAEDGTPGQTYWAPRTTNSVVGGYAAAELVSPYDWCHDPTVPLWRMQQGRYCGHRFKLPLVELERRSKLPVDDPSYLLPYAVEQLKDKRTTDSSGITGLVSAASPAPGTADQKISRTAFERGQSGSPQALDVANSKDKGVVNCVEMWVRMAAKDHDIYDSDEAVVWQFVVAGDQVLAMNESTNAHGMYPYSVGEARPNGHTPFSPGWALMLYGLQTHVDYLKDRHQEALQRTVGNVFIVDPEKVDIEDFMDPDKEGKIILLKRSASGSRISDIIQQVPIKDLTENFQDEMQSFVKYADTVTGANNFMQGSSADPAGSATEFAGTQQMAAGRMSNVARLISVQALVNQTKQFVTLYQQFLEQHQVVRYFPDPMSSPVALGGQTSLTISSDTIQGEFDFIAHDGTLPGTDSKKVAALSRLLEAAAVFPQAFAPAPGNLDPRKILFATAKASGVDTDRFVYDDMSGGQAVQGMVSAQTGIIPQVGPMGAPGMPQPPGPSPAVPTLPTVDLPALASAGPPEIRPGNL